MTRKLKDLIPLKMKNYGWHVLDTAKIRLGQYIVPDTDIEEFIKTISPLPRIAFTKQELASDLYTLPSGSFTHKEIIFSSIHRSGPAGLFTKLNADFYILKLDAAEECNSWKLRAQDCGGPSADEFNKFKNDLLFRANGERINEYPQSHFSVSSDSIDWGKYDAIISLDVSIPCRITKKFPLVKWCYLPNEPCMRDYRASHAKPIEGYNFFLNQRYRTIKLNPKPSYHEIDFPYHFHYYGCFHELLNIPHDHYRQEGCFIENRTSSGLTQQEYNLLEKTGPIRIPQEEALENVIIKELKSKYFLSLTRGVIRSRIWGNGIIEAVACGCLAFGNPEEYANKDLFTPFTVIRTFEEFIEKTTFLNENPDIYYKEVNKQRKLLNYLCFVRPIKEIIQKKIKGN